MHEEISGGISPFHEENFRINLSKGEISTGIHEAFSEKATGRNSLGINDSLEKFPKQSLQDFENEFQRNFAKKRQSNI